MTSTKIATFSNIKLHMFDTSDTEPISGDLELYSDKMKHITGDDEIVIKIEDIVRYQEIEYTKDSVDYNGFVLELFGPDYIFSSPDSNTADIIDIIEELKSDTIF